MAEEFRRIAPVCLLTPSLWDQGVSRTPSFPSISSVASSVVATEATPDSCWSELVHILSSRSSRPGQFTTWLAAISTAGSTLSIHRLAARAAIQRTGATGAIVLRADERGSLRVVESIPAGAPVESALIAAHGSSSIDPTPYRANARPDLLIAPLTTGDRPTGGLAPLHDREFGAIASSAAQAIERRQLRQRLDLSITAADRAAELPEACKEIASEPHDRPGRERALAGRTVDRMSTHLEPSHPSFIDKRGARELIDRLIGNARGPLPALEPASRTPLSPSSRTPDQIRPPHLSIFPQEACLER